MVVVGCGVCGLFLLFLGVCVLAFSWGLVVGNGQGYSSGQFQEESDIGLTMMYFYLSADVR